MAEIIQANIPEPHQLLGKGSELRQDIRVLCRITSPILDGWGAGSCLQEGGVVVAGVKPSLKARKGEMVITQGP